MNPQTPKPTNSNAFHSSFIEPAEERSDFKRSLFEFIFRALILDYRKAAIITDQKGKTAINM